MNLARILTIFRKDFRDALRDSRILVALIVPFAVGIFYNLVMDDGESQIDVTVAYSDSGQSALIQRLEERAGSGYRIRATRQASIDVVRRMVEDEDAALGLVIPTGFDAAVEAGEQPELTLLLPESPSIGGQYVMALLEPVLREMAGQGEPARINAEVVPSPQEEGVIERLGLRPYFVLISVLMNVVMVSLFVMPILLAEEAEKKTLDALVLIASYGEVVAAKALLGFVYVAIGVPLLMALTGLSPSDPWLFAVGIAGLSAALFGFGLLLGATFSATQLYSWGGFLILPFFAPAFIVGTPAPDGVMAVALLFPTGHAMRLAANGLSGEAIFSDLALSLLVIALWSVAGYALLLWRLARRES